MHRHTGFTGFGIVPVGQAVIPAFRKEIGAVLYRDGRFLFTSVIDEFRFGKHRFKSLNAHRFNLPGGIRRAREVSVILCRDRQDIGTGFHFCIAADAVFFFRYRERSGCHFKNARGKLRPGIEQRSALQKNIAQLCLCDPEYKNLRTAVVSDAGNDHLCRARIDVVNVFEEVVFSFRKDGSAVLYRDIRFLFASVINEFTLFQDRIKAFFLCLHNGPWHRNRSGEILPGQGLNAKFIVPRIGCGIAGDFIGIFGNLEAIRPYLQHFRGLFAAVVDQRAFLQLCRIDLRRENREYSLSGRTVVSLSRNDNRRGSGIGIIPV